MAFLSNNHMDFNQVFQNGIEFQRITEPTAEKPSINPLADKERNSTTFWGAKDKEVVKEIDLTLASGEPARINFQTKKIFDYFRNKYDFSTDKPKKNMEKYEYLCKAYFKPVIIYEEGKEEL